MDDLIRFTEPGGVLLISGLLKSDEPELKKELKNKPVYLKKVMSEDEWIGVILKKESE